MLVLSKFWSTLKRPKRIRDPFQTCENVVRNRRESVLFDKQCVDVGKVVGVDSSRKRATQALLLLKGGISAIVNVGALVFGAVIDAKYVVAVIATVDAVAAFEYARVFSSCLQS